MTVFFVGETLVRQNLESLLPHWKIQDYLTNIDSKINESIVFVQTSHLDQARPIIETSQLNESKIKVVALSELNEDQNIELLNQNPFITHLVSFDSPSYSDQIQLTSKLLSIDQNHVEPLPSINWQYKQLKMAESQTKGQCYEELEKFCRQLKIFDEFHNIVQTVASELLTNAFHDAPRDVVSDQPLHPDRSVAVSLNQPHSVDFSFGLENQNYLWIKTTDTFGTFSHSKLLKVLDRASRQKTAIMTGKGGAGLGIYMLYNWATSLCFFFKKGKRTDVVIRLKLCKRNLHFNKEKPSIHITEY